MSRMKVLCLIIVFTMGFAMGVGAVDGGPLVDIDVRNLSEGGLPSWSNGGALGGSFDGDWTGGATVQEVAGRKAVTFDGKEERVVSDFCAPARITGNSPFTVAVWAYNPEIGNEECLVQWAHRGYANRCAHLNYGTNEASGAVTHWGADQGYDGGPPAAGEWHLIGVTYEGGKDGIEKVWVDGLVNASAPRTLDLWPDEPIRLGFTEEDHVFSGALSAVWIFDYPLDSDEFAYLFSGTGKKPEPALVESEAKDLPLGLLSQWKNDGILGGAFGKEPTYPKVENVADRKAATFQGRQWLTSAAEFPESISGKHPFTVEVWAYNPAVSPGREVMLQWGNNHFSYGKDFRNGAFFASVAASLGYRTSPSGGEAGVPEAGRWHHIAYTYAGGSTETFAVYVDGKISSQKRIQIDTKRGGPIYVGCAWDGRRKVSVDTFTGSLAGLKIYDSCLSHYEIRNSMGLFDAFSPNPADGSGVEGFSVSLAWSRGGDEVESYDVYSGTDKSAVAKAGLKSPLFKGNQPVGNEEYGPVSLELGKVYYWRVDEADDTRGVRWPGEVWTFRAETGQAEGPQPRNGVSAVKIDTQELRWKPGKYAVLQDLHFGTIREQVAESSIADVENLFADADRCPIPQSLLEYGVFYYWRVDEINGDLPKSKGEVWSFRTEDEYVPNDVTFFAASDPHYGVTETVADANRMTIEAMNSFPGAEYPADLGGGIVKTPRGLILTGDLTNSGRENEWEVFAADCGVNGEGLVVYPVYEGSGNHDGDNPTGPVRGGIRERNKERIGLAAVSDNGLHYSWDWDQIHFVQLNLFPGNEVRSDTRGDPEYSLDFLVKDLVQNVGDSGRPVFVMHHYGHDGWGLSWWESPEAQDAFCDALKSYNVIGILHGHSHAAVIYEWRGLPIYNIASTQRDPEPGEFFVFHIKDNEMIVAHRFVDHWGDIRAKVRIKGVKPAVEAK